MKRVPITGILFCICLLAGGCAKHEGIPTESTYTFTNRTGGYIKLDLYGSQADYAQNARRLGQYIVAPDARQPMVLEVGKNYWIDWYNDDYTVSNWYPNSGNSPLPKINIADAGDERTISATQHDTVRSVVLGSSVSTSWKGTDDAGIEHRFVFRKDLSGVHTYVGNGSMVTENFSYQINTINLAADKRTISFELSISGESRNTSAEVRCNLMYLPPVTGRDSLVIYDFNSGGSGYFVVRQ